MKGLLIQRWERIRGSYWFLPSLMTLAAIVLSVVFINVDETVGADWMSNWHYLYANKPDGARALLSTIASSMIGVAGVTFSITIAAVAYASSSFGPRIISNFMRDTGNQVTLGTFIATYVYCLLILRTVRSGDEGGFVPHISVFFGVLLALASLGVLIFFIHHIPESIHVDHVVSGIGKEMLAKADSLYEESAEHADLVEEATPALPDNPFLVWAASDGYVQSIDWGELRAIASKHGIGLSLRVQPGDFVAEGCCLVAIAGDGGTDGLAKQVQRCFVQGTDRSPVQDLFYLIDQMVDIGARALSPGINDPFTAMAGIDWLCALLTRLSVKSFPPALWREGDAWVAQTKAADFRRYVDAIWDKLRPYVEKDRNAALHMLDQGLATVPGMSPTRSKALVEAMQALVEGCATHFEHSRDKAALELRRQRLRTI